MGSILSQSNSHVQKYGIEHEYEGMITESEPDTRRALMACDHTRVRVLYSVSDMHQHLARLWFNQSPRRRALIGESVPARFWVHNQLKAAWNVIGHYQGDYHVACQKGVYVNLSNVEKCVFEYTR